MIRVENVEVKLKDPLLSNVDRLIVMLHQLIGDH